MKHRFFKYITASVLVCTLLMSLTGCKSTDYREAVQLYNDRSYDAAAEIFYDLGDYKDSASLYTASRYWAAVALAEAGGYSPSQCGAGCFSGDLWGISLLNKM